MRKEVIFAIIAGISIGLVVAFGTWKVSKIIKNNIPIVINKETPHPKNNVSISIDTLKDFDVVNENPIIKGLALPNIDIIISTTEKDYYTKSNSDGEFEIQIELPTGMSEIKINDTKIVLVYSTEIANGATSYVGTITDISFGAIQIKNDKGGILQLSTTIDTSYVNTLKKNIAVKETDLAIGDYIVAMGFPATNKVLDAKRILIASPLQESRIEVTKITIEKLSKTTINDIKLPTKWVGPNVKELKVGQEIYVVGTKTDDKFDLRSIFVVK